MKQAGEESSSRRAWRSGACGLLLAAVVGLASPGAVLPAGPVAKAPVAPVHHAGHQDPSHGQTELRALSPSPLFQTSAASRTAPDPLGDIARLRERVRTSAPGTAGDRERRTAFQSLVRMAEPEAHQLLKELLERSAESPTSEPVRPLEFPRGILAGSTAEQLLDVVAEQAEVELVEHRLLNPDRVVVSLVERFLGYLSPAALVLGARTLDNSPESQTARLLVPVRRLLDRLPAPERRAGIQALLERGSAVRRSGATRLAVLARDLALLPVLGRLLDDTQLRPAAQGALRQLTFRPEPFSTNDELQQWCQRNPSVSFAELESRAARAWLEGGAGESRAELQRARDQVIELTRRLLRVQLAQSPIKWVEVLELLRGAQVPGLLPLGLAELLSFQGGLRKLAPGAEDQALRELREFLLEQARSTRRADERAVCLETFALLASFGDDKTRSAARLVVFEQAGRGEVQTRSAALRACRFFPGEDTVTSFLQILDGLLEQATRAPEGQALLRQGLQTLESLEVPVEPSLLERWFGLLERVLIAAREVLPPELRREALRVVGSAAREEALAVLERYMETVKDVPGEEPVRVQAFTWFETVACKIMVQAEAVLAGRVQERVFRVVQACLKDQTAALRGESAAALARIAETVKTLPASLLRASVDTVADALVGETDERAAVKMIDALRALGGVADRLAACLAGLARRAELERARGPGIVVDRLAEALSNLGMAVPATMDMRIQAVDTLVALGRRKAALAILTTYSPLEVRNGKRIKAITVALAALALPVRAETPSEVELKLADGVLEAVDLARSRSELRSDPKVDLHRVEVLALLGRFEAAVGLAEEVFRVHATSLPQTDMDVLRLRQATLLLRLRKVDDALAILGNIRGPSPATDQAQDLRAETLFQRQSYAEAENAFRAILQSGRIRAGTESALLATLRLVESLARQGKKDEASELLRQLTPPDQKDLLERFRAVEQLLRSPASRANK